MENIYHTFMEQISHIYNTFDSVIKHKHDIRDKVENQQALNNSINYLNNNAFTINNNVLEFILMEWNKEDSKYFNGPLNGQQLEINKKDSEIVKRSKQSHNSRYWRYLNIINIAKVYRNSVFYLPTFADRPLFLTWKAGGRIYTLSQYLSYQGDDLCRALLLFANDNDKNN